MRFDGTSPDIAAVTAMTGAMHRRGPDGSGVFAQGQVALGHRRLSVIDLTARGAQPMIDSEMRLALVFNGCIYNYRELRLQLQDAGYRFFSTSDAEVVLKAFHHWGSYCVDHFVGMFAFAVTDLDDGTVVLARDRLGIKPLYLAETPTHLRFASTLPALLRTGDVDTTIDPVALHHYLSFHSVVPAPHTIYRGVSKLPAATVRVISADGQRRDRNYWEPVFERHPERSEWNARDWQEALLGSLRTAVSRRMVADVPVGVLLSGGIDSSLVVALLAEQGQRDLATFSIGFDSAGGEDGDEYAYSDLVARTFGTDHHRIHIESSRLPAAVPDTIAAMSEPMVSHDCVAFFLLSQEVSRSVKVVQSGQGADEILAGYDWYPPLRSVPRGDAAGRYGLVFTDRSHDDINSLVCRDFRLPTDIAREFVEARFAAPGAATAIDAALRLDTAVMLTEDPVKRVDSMTMAWGLEARVPFLDQDFVELAATCPPDLKIASGGKGVLKDASRSLLPAEIVDRPKGYFPVPGIRHLDGDLLDLVRDALTGSATRERGLFEDAAVAALLADPNGVRTTLGANTLWQIAVLEMWLQSMDRLSRSPDAGTRAHSGGTRAHSGGTHVH